MRFILCTFGLIFGAVACSPKYNVLGLDTDEPDLIDPADYEGATLRILSPTSGSFVPYGEISEFQAELLDKNGEPLEFNEIEWTSSVDTTWDPDGLVFEDDSLDVGLHDITAQVNLPNGDRLAYSVGGVLVQSIWAGTYVGTFTADVKYDEFPLGCAGSAVLLIDPYGDVLTGDADCVVPFGGNNFELAFVFDVEHDGDGNLEGVVAADLFGWFQFDFDASGGIDIGEESLTVEFGGSPFSSLSVDGSVSADRISLDAGL